MTVRALPDARASRAVLIGVSRYTTLEPLPGVANNLTALAEVLTSAHTWALPPEHCAIVAEPANLREMLDPVQAAADAARDVLLVYFAGHGLNDTRGDLFFGLHDSKPGLGHTGVSYQSLRDILVASRARRFVIILDCCFSGRALGLMSSADSLADQAEIDGSYLLAAAPETGLALAPPGEKFTAFTGELVEVLTTGIVGGPPELDLESVYDHVRSALRAKARPVPQKRARNTAGRLLLARNLAYLPSFSRPVPEQSDPRWPDPTTFHTPETYLEALAHVRVISGKTVQALSEESSPPISRSTISNLLNRTTLPRTWKTTQVFLTACGMTPELVDVWKAAWRRLKEVELLRPSPSAPTSSLNPAQERPSWRSRFRPRRSTNLGG